LEGLRTAARADAERTTTVRLRGEYGGFLPRSRYARPP
jgi:hypothetical protein